MAHRVNDTPLDGYFEMDEGFFEGHRKKPSEVYPEIQPKELDRQAKVIVGVSTKEVKPGKRKKYRPETKPLYLKMDVVNALASDNVNWASGKMVNSQATVHTDGRRCYGVLKGLTNKHLVTVVKDKTKISQIFPWVHTAISNAKKKISGLHHQVKDEYMQNYLSEFCYKFNRSQFGQQLADCNLGHTLV